MAALSAVSARRIFSAAALPGTYRLVIRPASLPLTPSPFPPRMKDMPPFEYFDHTADMGMLATGKDLPELFSHSAQGMFNLIVPLDQFKDEDAFDVLLEAPNVKELLWKWLRELHYLFSTQKTVFKKFEFKNLTEKMVWATCWGEYFDPEKHSSEREVKAVTYHEFEVLQETPGWKARVIFDI